MQHRCGIWATAPICPHRQVGPGLIAVAADAVSRAVAAGLASSDDVAQMLRDAAMMRGGGAALGVIRPNEEARQGARGSGFAALGYGWLPLVWGASLAHYAPGLGGAPLSPHA